MAHALGGRFVRSVLRQHDGTECHPDTRIKQLRSKFQLHLRQGTLPVWAVACRNRIPWAWRIQLRRNPIDIQDTLELPIEIRPAKLIRLGQRVTGEGSQVVRLDKSVDHKKLEREVQVDNLDVVLQFHGLCRNHGLLLLGAITG
jgi:hypothetical protein